MVFAAVLAALAVVAAAIIVSSALSNEQSTNKGELPFVAGLVLPASD
ncbi:hypothetical protein GCM10027569_58140 [Flindersiella endophytica]